MQQGSKIRSLYKAITWRLLGTTATFIISYALTSSIEMSGGISILDLMVKTGLYYTHERIWNRI